jgi:hypothetical protein
VDQASILLNQEQVDKMLALLSEKAITYVTFGDIDDLLYAHDAVLAIDNEGEWQWRTIQDGHIQAAVSQDRR